MPLVLSGDGVITGMNSGSSTDLSTVFAKLAGPTFAAGNLVWSSATLRIASDAVTTNQSTTSASYTDLTTSGPAVTITTGTKALVIIGANCYNSTTGASLMSFAVSGSSSISAADGSATWVKGTNEVSLCRVFLVSGLTAGSNTFTAKYRTSAGTANFEYRNIIVIDMGS